MAEIKKINLDEFGLTEEQKLLVKGSSSYTPYLLALAAAELEAIRFPLAPDEISFPNYPIQESHLYRKYSRAFLLLANRKESLLKVIGRILNANDTFEQDKNELHPCRKVPCSGSALQGDCRNNEVQQWRANVQTPSPKANGFWISVSPCDCPCKNVIETN